MSQQHHPGNSSGEPQAPWYGGEDSSRAPKTFPYGEQEQQIGSQGQSYGQDQPYGQQPPSPYQRQGSEWNQLQQSQYGSQGQPYGSQGQPYGSQGQPYGQQQPPSPYQQQGSGGRQQPVAEGRTAHGQQQFHGILDPHTGEIHPVPDLENLQDTDALLVVVSGPDAGAQILLDTDVVTVGRSPNADIFLDDVTVSRKHAEFVRTPSGFTLRDTGSLNGTYVGRQLIDSIELQNGADVQIGKFRMIFQQRPRSS